MNNAIVILIASVLLSAPALANEKPRARDIGIAPGVLAPGNLNAITDVSGVKVGQVTVKDGTRINTGVTVVIPAEGNLRQDKVPAAIFVANGYGKLAGISQVRELGELETPIALTNTLNVAEGIAALVEWTLAQPGNEEVRSVNAVVGETNDGYLNDIRARVLTKNHFIEAIESAKSGPVDEGAVGAGTGTVAFGFKGGIGTSSRKLPQSLGGFTVGVLVQSNFGGVLKIDGVRVGEVLGQHYLKDEIANDTSADGSIMIVAATDAPLGDRNLQRLARRAIAGLARTGASMTNGSGDYVIAFSTAESVRRRGGLSMQTTTELANSAVSPLFQAVAEATEEAIYNSLLQAENVTGKRGVIKALPVDKVKALTLSSDQWPDASGPYLGQNPPGMTVEMFAPGVVSTDRSEINSVFTPDGNEFYFTTWTQETGTKIMVARQVDGRWGEPVVASFSNHASDVDPAISHDGERVFFSSRRPRPGESETRTDGFDLWFAERTESGWGEEQFLGPVVNSGESQVYSTATRDGTLYFQAVREGGYGKADIYRSRLLDGAYQTPENLGPVINSEHYEGDVFIAHDESYLIVSVYGREDGFGGADLHISFRSLDGSWSPLKNMGSAVNSDKRDFCPIVTPDGKYFFFSSKRNGEGDIFWIDAKVIQTLRDD